MRLAVLFAALTALTVLALVASAFVSVVPEFEAAFRRGQLVLATVGTATGAAAVWSLALRRRDPDAPILRSRVLRATLFVGVLVAALGLVLGALL